MTRTYFVVHYDPADPFLAHLVAQTAEDELARVSKDLGYKPDPQRPFPLYVYRTHISFIKAGGLEESKFTVGTARGGDDRISVDASGIFAPTSETTAHEVTHVIIFRILGQAIGAFPLWANEGLAKYESEEYSGGDDVLVADAASDNTLMPLSELTGQFPEKRTGLAYAESSSSVRYMVSEYGRSAPRRLLHELAATGSLDKAMLKATGQTTDQFADEWAAAVGARYLGLRVSRVFTGVISAVMAVLAVFAYLRRRRQKIEETKQWEQEELDEAIRRQQGNDWSR